MQAGRLQERLAVLWAVPNLHNHTGRPRPVQCGQQPRALVLVCGDALPPAGFWPQGQPPPPRNPPGRSCPGSFPHGEEARGLFISSHHRSFAICGRGRKAPVTSPTCGGHFWEQETKGQQATCPSAREEQEGTGRLGLGLEGSGGPQHPLTCPHLLLLPALIAPVPEKPPRHAQTEPTMVPLLWAPPESCSQEMHSAWVPNVRGRCQRAGWHSSPPPRGWGCQPRHLTGFLGRHPMQRWGG